MAISILTLEKPWLWVEATSGGTLAATTSFYFTGYNSYESSSGSYGGHAPSPAADEVYCTTTSANKTIKMEIYEQGGYISGFSDAGSGLVTATTSTPHGMTAGVVYIRGSVNYTGSYTMSSITSNGFNFTKTWAGNDGACRWFKTPGLPDKNANYGGSSIGFHHKWDYYSMLRVDGSKMQWFNTNNPTYTNEWVMTGAESAYNAYGHRRWGGGYLAVGMTESYLTTAADGSKYRNFTAVSSVSTSQSWSSTNLWEQSTAANGNISGHGHPEISMRKYINAAGTTYGYSLPEGMTENSSGSLILIDNTNTNNTWVDLVTAIVASNILGKSIILSKDSISGVSETSFNILTIRGSIYCNGPFSSTQSWYNKNITLLHGQVSSSGSLSTYKMTLNGCTLFNEQLWTMLSISNSYIGINSNNYFGGYLFSIENLVGSSNLGLIPTISGTLPSVTAAAVSGFNISGIQTLYANTANIIRYWPNNYIVSDINFIHCTMNPTLTVTNFTGTIQNVSFTSIQSDLTSSSSQHNFDIYIEQYTQLTGVTCNIVFECNNVTSDERSNKLVRVKFHWRVTTTLWNTNSNVVFNFNFLFEVTVVDSNGNYIQGATVLILNNNSTPNTYSITTDASGLASTYVRTYEVKYDSTNPDGYWQQTATTGDFWSKTSVYNTISVSVSKSGYITSNTVLTGVLSKQCFIITLTSALSSKVTLNGDVIIINQPQLGINSDIIKI